MDMKTTGFDASS